MSDNPSEQERADVLLDLAAYAHSAWAGWMRYLFEVSSHNLIAGTVTIPQWAAERWYRQMTTEFKDLPLQEQASDFKEANHMLEIMQKHRDVPDE